MIYEVRVKKTCSACGGTGRDGYFRCSVCEGRGKVEAWVPMSEFVLDIFDYDEELLELLPQLKEYLKKQLKETNINSEEESGNGSNESDK